MFFDSLTSPLASQVSPSRPLPFVSWGIALVDAVSVSSLPPADEILLPLRLENVRR
jgi:hypothetical protein